ncbi:MAG: poly-gamma-glutamate biosynthesis protein PgsC/CapC, partial [Gammaproteobacteria bacterium]|nr:poly-gamma-glutamate biosynthesis protein PgsC/CapC [Gammaproteobacteria bacterium]
MDIFPVSIFPISSLASSIIPVVWVGMFVVCFFNLRLGWVLSGLIVPGYVVPLILVKPWSAAVIFLESIITYGLVWLFSEYLSRKAPWCNFFGRDRFF